MRVFWTRKDEPLGGNSSFYCRHDNRVVGGCPIEGGPCDCPLRPECPAFAEIPARARAVNHQPQA
jgi:hypothetical protein